MNIATKIALGFSAVLLCFLVIGRVVYSNTERLIADNKWVTHTHAVLEALAEVRLSLRGAEASVQRYVLTGNDSDLSSFRAVQSSLDAALNDMQRLTADNATQQRQAQLARTHITSYFATLDRIAAVRDEHGNERASELVAAGVSRVDLDEARRLLRAMREEEERLLEQRSVVSDRTAQESLNVIALGGVIVLLLCIAAGWVIARMVTTPVRHLLHGAEHIGRGNLQHRIIVEAQDELGRLAEAFNTMAKELSTTTVSADTDRKARARIEGLLETIGDTATNLVSATAEILAATTQQVTGAQEQASAVAETVAAVNEVVATSEQAAERARAVSTIAQHALDHTRNGKKVVEHAITAMATVKSRVESSAESILALAEQAQAIGDIISSVTELAEQTNMLALSASIEATRAGESGRGFGVVAKEVKALSDQSKRAAARVTQILKQIKKATGDAVMGTEECGKSVSSAAHVIGQAGESIRALAEIIDQAALDARQIAVSAGQQAVGTAQIHEAMKSIDQVTHQNMSSSRQMELAARDLNLLGGRLRERLSAADAA
ncbi:MAG: methyl-accepting chemotaxis protein [Polyangiales bacterium]